MPKRVVTALVLVILCSLPGSDRALDEGRRTVTVWMYPVIADTHMNQRYWDRIEREFEDYAPGTDLIFRHQSWERRDERLVAAFARGKGPDVALLAPDQIPRLVEEGWISPVDRVLGDSAGRFLPTAVGAVSQGGRIYAAPIYQTVATTIYNMRLLKSAGVTRPPGSWDELRAAAVKTRAAGFALLDYSAHDDASLNLNFYPLLWQAGGRVFTEDGRRVAFDGPEGIEALTFLTDLYKTGAIPPSSLQNTNLLAGHALGRQQAAMGFAVVLRNAELAARLWGPDNVLVGAPLKGPAKEVAFGMPGALAISSNGNKAGAEEFLSFMLKPRQIKSLGRESGFFSPRADVTVPSDSPYAREYQTALASAFPGEPHPSARRVMQLLAPEIRAALTGRKSPEQALKAAAEAANELLSRS
ncbi:ABC transporter substrate-binding protein [Streptomyces sp. enrichment culture]|uniref:ABC transporter substrate-binding protein n=1 Tax=Streptomyces sp. enrichment culture TaxID=1795815 RepID=UPI003F5691BF